MPPSLLITATRAELDVLRALAREDVRYVDVLGLAGLVPGLEQRQARHAVAELCRWGFVAESWPDVAELRLRRRGPVAESWPVGIRRWCATTIGAAAINQFDEDASS